MKRAIIVSICIFLSNILLAQILVRYDEWYKIISINNNEEVFVTEQDSYNIYNAITGYKLKGEQLVESDFETMPIIRDSNLVYSPVHLWGNYLKLKNNHYRATIFDTDSIVSSDKRILKVYRTVSGSKSNIIVYKLVYINDSTILETIYNPLNTFSEAILYLLDRKQNLRNMKEAFVESKKINTDSIDIRSIRWDKVSNFYYNKARSRVDSIKITSILMGNKKATNTQVFIYKNGRPASSYVMDESKKKIAYRQFYKYM